MTYSFYGNVLSAAKRQRQNEKPGGRSSVDFTRGGGRFFFKNRADSTPVINQSESVILGKLLYCCRSIVHVYRPKPLQFPLVNGAVCPSVSLDLFVDVRRKSSHISTGIRDERLF